MAKDQQSRTRLARYAAVVRIIFGLVWAIDAFFKWQPPFANHFLDIITSSSQNQPTWLQPWFNFWLHLISHNPQFFAIMTATIETLIALALLLGFARRATYLLAAVFSLMIWSIAEGFGGPYSSSSTDIGAAAIYAIVFIALYGLDHLTAPAIWSLDIYITKILPWWAILANP